MARKLTDEERKNLDLLREALCAVLEPSQKNKAASVASALVRVRSEVVTEEDLAPIFKRCGKDAQAIEAAVRSRALNPVEGQEGVYTLRVPEGKPMEEDSEAPVAPADAAPEAGLTSDPAPEPAETPEAPVVAAPDATEPPVEAATLAPRHTARRRISKRRPVAEPDDAAVVPTEPSAPEPAAPDLVAPQETEPPAPDAPARPPVRQTHGRVRRMGKGSPSKPVQLSDVPYVRRGGPAETEMRAKVLELDQRFWMNGWLLSHPGAYTLFERQLTALNDALVNGALPGDITRRQLAYQMGGDEKFFEYGSDGHRLLRAMGMEDVIRHRPMPKPDLLYHAPRRRKHMRVLVTENLDPWLDVHDLMYEEGRTTILGERIHAVVLGGGTPILEHNRLALLLDTLGADSVEVLYWGDIDRAGIDIMVRLRDVLGEHYPFAPFIPAYQLMIDKAQERYPNPADNEQTCQVNIGMPDMSPLRDGLTEEAAVYARTVVEGCRLIPQEILTRRDL